MPASPSTSHSRRHIPSPLAATLMYPSAVSNTPVGMLVGWLFPAWGGTSPAIVQRAAWKSSIAICASSRDECTQRPSPVSSRSSSATKMPMEA